MSNRADDRPRIIGDPPTAVRPAYDLEADAVRLMLTARSVPRLMELLDMDEQDRAELAALLPSVVADAELLAAVTEMANLLRREAGLDAATAPLEDHAERLNALQERIVPGQGLLVILAHMVATDVVRAWHMARGLSEQESWLALSDLGQQMRVHRATFGELGHHTVGWTALNWAGRLFWLGRLQFDLHRDGGDGDGDRDGDGDGDDDGRADDGGKDRTDRGGNGSGGGRWQIGTHIPATGPLLPAEVNASFDRATGFFSAHFGDLDAHEFVCHSWLVNAELPEIVGPGSNLGSFAARWEIEKTFRADDDAVFFVFNRRPPYDPARLPTDTRLRTAIVERLLDGRGWTGGAGRLTRS